MTEHGVPWVDRLAEEVEEQERSERCAERLALRQVDVKRQNSPILFRRPAELCKAAVERWQERTSDRSVEFQPVSDHSFQVIRSGFPRIKLEVWRTGDSEIIEFLFTVTRSWYAEPTQDRDQFWISVDRGENLTLTDGDKTLDLQAATERLVRPLLRPGTT